MKFVLVQRVLKFVLFLVDALSPLPLLLAAKDPALVVFGFDHENAEARDCEVGDLCRALAIGAGKVDVVIDGVAVGGQALQSSVDDILAEPAFDTW